MVLSKESGFRGTFSSPVEISADSVEYNKDKNIFITFYQFDFLSFPYIVSERKRYNPYLIKIV